MCGIVAAQGEEPILSNLLKGLERLEYRGYDSCGVAYFDSKTGAIERTRTVKRVSDLVEQTKALSESTFMGIAHTRWATHGVPCEKNAHPHVSEKIIDNVLQVFSVVHNGIIENYQELKNELIKKGYHFQSDTDTEVIAHLVADYYIDNLTQAVNDAVLRLHGAYAIAVIASVEPEVLVGARHGSPLLVGKTEKSYYLASDSLALTGYADEITYLEDGDIVKINLNNFFICKKATFEMVTHQRAFAKMDSVVQDASLGDFANYMQKEIHEQPKAIFDCLSQVNEIDSSYYGVSADRALNIFKEVDSVLILACGTSYYSGCVAKYWLESFAKIETHVEIASEFRYRNPYVNKNKLVIVISQSGETADTLSALRYLKANGVTNTLTICNVPTSSMVRECSLQFLTNAGPEVGVASTKAFTTQLVSLYVLMLSISKARGTFPFKAEDEPKLINQIKLNAPSLVTQTIALEPQIKRWAELLSGYSSAIFLGRDMHYPVAQEGALKLKEISYIHAECYSAGELKHGPLALICEEMPVVVLAPFNEMTDKLNSNIQEVAARKGRLFIVADQKTELPSSVKAEVIRVPYTASGPVSTLVYAVVMQLLAYHTATVLGNDVDKPRNLAKSVTVE